MARWIGKVRAAMRRKGTVGAFTAQAKAAGMGVQAFARKVLAKGSGAGTTTKRRAAFAKAMASIRRKRG